MKLNFDATNNWRPDGLVIKCIDAHTEGEPLRVILAGYPQPAGNTILARRRDLETNYDALRTALMWEPRGHADMYGCLVTEPVRSNADFGVLFMHNEGYSTMCGHGIIAVTKVVVETGVLPMSEPETQIEIDTPAGPVTAWARVRSGSVESVRFRNVSSYAYTINQTVEVPEFGPILYDIGFGGAYYAYVCVSEVGLKTTPTHYGKLIHAGKMIKKAVMASMPIDHPSEPDLGFLYGTIFTGPPESADAHSRHVCVFADGEVDRSPTGTGVSGRLAVLHEKGLIGVGECIKVESIIGSSFNGTIVQTSSHGENEFNSIIPEIEGRAFITGQHEFVLDPKDPLKNGFLLR